VHVARPADVLHQIHTLWLQRPINTLENIEWLGLIVNGVKGRDEIEGFGFSSLVEVAQIDGRELGIVEPGSRSERPPGARSRFARLVRFYCRSRVVGGRRSSWSR
jgi:hypothetical protein